MQGLQKCDTSFYSIKDINKKEMWIDFLENFGGRIKADGLDNFYDLMIDPITKEVCEIYHLPTDYIEISPAFLAILCAYYYFDPACTFWPFVSALLFHEAGHLLLLWLLGARVHKLRLTVSGAVIVTEPLSYGQEIAVAAAGPACNLLIFLLNARRCLCESVPLVLQSAAVLSHGRRTDPAGAASFAAAGTGSSLDGARDRYWLRRAFVGRGLLSDLRLARRALASPDFCAAYGTSFRDCPAGTKFFAGW